MQQNREESDCSWIVFAIIVVIIVIVIWFVVSPCCYEFLRFDGRHRNDYMTSRPEGEIPFEANSNFNQVKNELSIGPLSSYMYAPWRPKYPY
jgi:hypothetical protein